MDDEECVRLGKCISFSRNASPVLSIVSISTVLTDR